MMGFDTPFSDTMVGSDSCITTVMDVGKADKKPKGSFSLSPKFWDNMCSPANGPNDGNPSILSMMPNGFGKVDG